MTGVKPPLDLCPDRQPDLGLIREGGLDPDQTGPQSGQKKKTITKTTRAIEAHGEKRTFPKGPTLQKNTETFFIFYFSFAALCHLLVPAEVVLLIQQQR